MTFPDSQTAAYDEDTKGTNSAKTLAFWLYFSFCLDTYLNLALVQIQKQILIRENWAEYTGEMAIVKYKDLSF